MSLFHFLRPEWFFSIIPLAILYWLLRRLQLQNKSWHSFCDKDLLPFLFKQDKAPQKKPFLPLLLIGGLLTIISLAGPTWEKRPQPVFKKQSALVIVLDLSRSMDATDIKPSRLTRAIHKVEDILKLRTEGQTALIVYAGDAFTVTPLTEDTATISSQIKSLSTDVMPVQGSQTHKAIELAHKLFTRTSLQSGHILLITDGINNDAFDSVKKYLQNKYTLSVLGIGTTDGAPIPLSSGGFFKDKNGAIVIPKLNREKLHQLALTGSGTFQMLSTTDSDINILLRPLSGIQNDQQSKSTELNTDSWFETGPWLLLPVLIISLLAFRKGYLFALAFICIQQPEPAYALDWNSLWKNNNQQAEQLLRDNKALQAAEKFSDKEWKAGAEYKSGNYQQALETYKSLESSNPDIQYNLANTQAQLGMYDEALQTYNKIIENNPGHTDAIHNRDLIEKMKQQDNKASDENKSDDKQSNDKQNNKSDSKDSSSQNNQDAKNSESDNQKDSKQSKDTKEPQQSDSQNKDNASEENDKDKQEKQSQSSETQADDKKQNEDEQQAKSLQHDQPSKEQQQANEQWLRRIPDDPGGLLRRKFQYQTQQRPNNNSGDQQW